MGDQKEIVALKELKERMKGDMENELYEDDNMFIRFLRARDLKIDHAETMLRQHLEWRKKYDMKNMINWNPPEILKEYFHLITLGYDKGGCILKYNHFGNTDFRGIFESCTQEDWLKFLIYNFEQDVVELKSQTKKLGKTVDKVLYIENLEHFSLAKATDKKVISTMIVSINMYLNNYPETLKVVYAINAPVYFNIFYSVLRPFLPSQVVKKIRIYSDDSWRKDILEAIDAEVLPVFLGGTRTDPDGNPLCSTLLRGPELVPKKYYLNRNKQSFPTLTDAERISISRNSAHEVIVEVKEPCSYLEWEFEVKSGDIKFGLYHKDEKDNKTELIPPQRINTEACVESGLYKCENEGSYIVMFDNTYSFLKGKEICYKLKVKKPEETESNLTE